MTAPPKIQYTDLDALFLDPKNPRLGRKVAAPNLPQERILEAMSDWTLDELAVSFLESGFWPQESLLVVNEQLYGADHLVVVEGNRRLAALKLLQRALAGDPLGRKWKELVQGVAAPENLFKEVPYIEVASRSDVTAYLGFRHVTGIKEWAPAEKAEYIARLIDEEGLSYEEVRKRIGSKTPTVRQNYISFNLLLQMENEESIDMDRVEEKFSVLYLSLRTSGAQKYLHIDIHAEPDQAKRPVPQQHLKSLVNFARWLFGDEKRPPLFTDSRLVDSFGQVLESTEAIEYLERTDEPRFEVAIRKAGVGQEQVVELIQGASDNIQLALSEVHLYRKEEKVSRVVGRLKDDMLALTRIFPAVWATLQSEVSEDAAGS